MHAVGGYRGGQIVAIPADITAIPCPDGVPVKLWDTLSSAYNCSQLMAIKYVSDEIGRLEDQDTRIALVQGPVSRMNCSFLPTTDCTFLWCFY